MMNDEWGGARRWGVVRVGTSACLLVVACWVLFDMTHAGAEDEDVARPAASSAAPKDAWPLFRGDGPGTGVAGAALPEKLELLWTFSVDGGGFESTAAIADGTVYAGCTDGKLYAVDLA
ncbi:MAG TPA: PQQ-binding-like beta-propeller repeat protein, partial [Thermoguttaceae bacterium]|nr:PQQ-binding-like beta-propeller repeat protein [Thermoguttaceae bacterium]